MLALEQRGLVFCAVARMQAEITRRPASCWCFTCMTMWREGSWMQRSVWQSDNRNVTSLRCVSNVAAQFSLYCFWLQVVLSASATRPCYTTVQEVGNERVTGATHLTWLHLSVWSGESEEEDLCLSHVCWDSADTSWFRCKNHWCLEMLSWIWYKPSAVFIFVSFSIFCNRMK